MCGICGFIGNLDDTVLSKMLNVLRHRGPDDSGCVVFKGERSKLKVSLGHTRLSIIDLSLAGHQPMSNEDESIWITYNGEIYNYKALSSKLKAQGHKFKSNSDTETILHLYEEMGDDCVNELNGMFAFAIWDKRKERLFLARDRLGIKPLYYLEDNGRFVFASEIKAILEYDGVEREVDYQALLYFMTFLYIPCPFTIFKGIRKLPPAHILTMEKGRVEVKRYWDLVFSPPLQVSSSQATPAEAEEYYKRQIMEILQEIVESHMISDVPLGVFLSGGIDSSTVAGMMSKLSSNPVKTFSIGYEGREGKSYNELEYSKEVSKYFGTEHQEFILNPSIIEVLPNIVWHLDEPFADSSAIPTYLVSEAARKYVTVALTGIGGDEVFGGYPRYLGARVSRQYAKLPFWLRRSLARGVEVIPESSTSRNIPGWIKRFIRGGLLPVDERYISWVSFLTDRQKTQLFTEDFLAQTKDFPVYEVHKAFYSENNLENILDKIFYLDIKTYLADDLLMMGDKMSMAHSLELRVPFCDHKLIEFAATIPAELKFKGLKLKSLFKKALKGFLPEDILQRKKQGFMVPLAKWFQNELKGFTLDLLSEERIKKRGYFRPDFIRWVLDQHYDGRQNFTDQIYALISLELWHQIYMD